MKALHIIIGVLALASASAAQAQDTTAVAAGRPLTLDECLTVALSQNPTIHVADMDITRVDYAKKETLAQLLPTVSFGATYSRMLAKQVMYMDMSMPGMGGGAEGDPTDEQPEEVTTGKGEGIKMGRDNSWQLGFNASMPLIAPQLWKSLKLSDANILQSVENARQSRLSLVNEVKSAYYALLLAVDSRAVLQESYDMASLTHDIYVKKQSAGAASEYEVLRTSVAMKNLEPDITQADLAIRRARLQLLILMGVDAEWPLQIAGTLADYQKDMYGRALATDAQDLSQNSSLRLNAIQSQQLKAALDVQKMAWLPTLSLAYNYNWTSMSNGSAFKGLRWNPYSTVGLTLSVPLLEGGGRWSRQRQAEVQLAEMTFTRQDLERQVNTQVKLAQDDIRLNIKQIASSKESIMQAERAYDIMDKSFQVGAASYLDFRDSQLSLTQARLSYNQCVYNYLISDASLELLLGNAPLERWKQ